MLVLSRKTDDSILIKLSDDPLDDVWVTVVEIRGDKVKLGITAAPHIVVDRQEVAEAKLRNPRNAN